MQILFVYLGNICRSPLAEGILKDKLNKLKQGHRHHVDSVGFERFHRGDNPDPRSIQVARKYGIDISAHVARLFETTDFDRYDLIYVMDHSNYANVMEMARDDQDRQKVDFIMNLLQPGKNLPVPDPWYGGMKNFEEVYQLLDKATDKLSEILHG
jgi:protein-tyrosine phosphatase